MITLLSVFLFGIASIASLVDQNVIQIFDCISNLNHQGQENNVSYEKGKTSNELYTFRAKTTTFFLNVPDRDSHWIFSCPSVTNFNRGIFFDRRFCIVHHRLLRVAIISQLIESKYVTYQESEFSRFVIGNAKIRAIASIIYAEKILRQAAKI